MKKITCFKATKDSNRFNKNQKVWVIWYSPNHSDICFKWRGKGRYVTGVINNDCKSIGKLKRMDISDDFFYRLANKYVKAGNRYSNLKDTLELMELEPDNLKYALQNIDEKDTKKYCESCNMPLKKEHFVTYLMDDFNCEQFDGKPFWECENTECEKCVLLQPIGPIFGD